MQPFKFKSPVSLSESQRQSAINRPSFTLSFTFPTFKMLSLQNAIMRAKSSTEVDYNLRTSMNLELGQAFYSTYPVRYPSIY